MFVAIVKVAALNYGNAHSTKIANAGSEKIGARMILPRYRPSFDLERDGETITAQRQRVYRARRLHARHRLEAALQVDEKLGLPVAVVFDFRQLHVERKDVLRLQTAVHVSQTPETLDQQSSAHQQHHRDRELAYHQHVANAIASRAFTRASPTFFQRFHQFTLRGIKRGRQSEYQSGEIGR